jgi:hypothetical protein
LYLAKNLFQGFGIEMNENGARLTNLLALIGFADGTPGTAMSTWIAGDAR